MERKEKSVRLLVQVTVEVEDVSVILEDKVLLEKKVYYLLVMLLEITEDQKVNCHTYAVYCACAFFRNIKYVICQ